MSQIGNPAASSSGPTGPAGGDLTGTYPNPTLAWISRTAAQTLAIGVGGTLAALAFTVPGSGVATALGNTAGGVGGFALVGATPPTGAAGGDLAGTYPNPTLNTSISTAVAFSGLGLTAIAAAGSAPTPALSLTNFETGTGWYVTAVGKVGLSVSGTLRFDYGITRAAQWNFSNNVFMTSNLSLVGAGSALTVANAILTGPSVAALQLGAANVPSGAVGQTLKVQDNTGTTTTGPDFNIVGSGGTTIGGNVVIQTKLTTTAAAALTLTPGKRVNSAGTLGTAGYTVATLPAGVVGDRAYVTDALAPSFLTIVVGGGTVNTPVYFNGANWIGA